MNDITLVPKRHQVETLPRRRWLGAAASLVVAALPAAAAPRALDQPALSEVELAREELAHLCLHMELLRAWWKSNGDMVRHALPEESKGVHDCFIEGVLSARSVARKAGITVDMDYVNSSMGVKA